MVKKMKDYTIDLSIKVLLDKEDVTYYDVDIIKLTVTERNKQNALLKAFKLLDLDLIKFIRKNTIKYGWQDDWSTALSFEIYEVENIMVNAQP